MSNPDELKAIFDRITENRHTKADITALRNAFTKSEDQTVAQLGRENINIGDIGQARDIHLGDRIYQGLDAGKIRDVIRQIQPLSRKEFQNRRKLITEVNSTVERWLEVYTHNKLLINLQKEAQPKLVKRPGDEKFRIFPKPNHLLPKTTSIINYFDEKSITGKLLILGEPGSGKTANLIELMQHLIHRAENDYIEPIPVWLNLSSWHNQKIDIWLASEIKSLYGLPSKVSIQMLNNRQIIPLLDGLDELDSIQQAKCVGAINYFLASDLQPEHLVVCSRINEYKRCFPALELNGAVCLLPLSEINIQQYLMSFQRTDIWMRIQRNQNILEIVNIPLFLFVFTRVYEQISIEEFQIFNSDKERYGYLFNAYIELMIETPVATNRVKNKKYSPKNIRKWLAILAQRMSEDRKKEFLIEQIHPDWLNSNIQKQIYFYVVAFIIGLISLPILVLILTLIQKNHILFQSMKMQIILIIALLNSIFIGALFSFSSSDIKPVENIKLPGSELIKAVRFVSLKERLMGALMANFRIPNVTNNDNKNNNNLLIVLNSLTRGFIGAVMPFTAPIRGLVIGLRGPDIEIEKRNIPNQGIYKSALSAVIYALIFAFIGIFIGIIFGLINNTHGFTDGNNQLSDKHLIPILIFGWVGGLSGGLAGGLYAGLACIQHFTLRLLLWKSGCISWNYALFLDYTTKQRFLQRIGGRYRFIHPLLQEHFARMD